MSVPYEEVINTPIHIGATNKRFGDLTLEDAQARGDELQRVAGGALVKRVAPVARAWKRLAREMEERGARVVADLDRDTVMEYAEPLWVVPPGGSLL